MQTEKNLQFVDGREAVSPPLKMVGLRSSDVDTAEERGLIPGKAWAQAHRNHQERGKPGEKSSGKNKQKERNDKKREKGGWGEQLSDVSHTHTHTQLSDVSHLSYTVE